MANISGVTRINGNIESCTVRLYDRVTGDLISEVNSNALTGEYIFPNLTPGIEYDVVCIGSVEVCPQISGPLSPTVNTDYYDAVIASAPTAYWRMDDTDSTLTDDLGLYNGTYSGTPLYNQLPLLNEGVSVEMDGSTDSSQVADNAALRPGTGEYAIEMWMSFTSTGLGMAFGKFSLSSPFRGPTVFCNYFNDTTTAGRIELRDERTIGYWVDSIQGSLNDGIPRHYVFQRRLVSTSPDVWKLEMYIDGVLDNSVTLASVLDLATTEPVYVASRPSQYVAGNFDEISYYVGKALTPSEVATHYQAGLLPGVGIYENLTILDLRFDEPVSSTTFIDSSVKSNTVNTFGGAIISDAQSHSGGVSLLLDGVDDYVTVDHSDGLFSTKGDLTVEAWIYRNSDTTRDVIASKYSTFSTDGFTFQIFDNDTIGFAIGSGGYQNIVSTATIPAGQWVHVAATKEGQVTRIFVNGILEGELTTTGTPNDNSVDMFIGRDSVAGDRHFDGYIDSFKWTHGVAKYTADFTPV